MRPTGLHFTDDCKVHFIESNFCSLILFTWTDADLSSVGHIGTDFSEIWIKTLNNFIKENVFEKVICKMLVILFIMS